MLKRLLCIGLVMLLASCALSCAGVDNFDASIKAMPYTATSSYVSISSLEDLMEIAKPNLIVKCEVVSREDSTIFDPSGEHSESDIQATSPISEEEKLTIAGSYLSTPYRLTIDEVLLGEDITSGDEITINAPYGILGEYQRRDGYFPILKVGSEYLMFLRVDMMFGQKVYYLAFPPASALEITADTYSGEYADFVDTVFGEFNGSATDLMASLNQLISTNEYDLTMDVVE